MAPEARPEGGPAGPTRVTDGLLLVLPGIMLAALLSRPIELSDLGWQLRLGAQMIAARSPFIVEQMVFTHQGEPLLPNAWLAQVAFAAAQLRWGWGGLHLFDALVWLSGLLVPAGIARRQGRRPLAVVLALVVAFAVAVPSAAIRPQSFALPGFALFLALLRWSEHSWHAVWLAVPLLVLWQNLHPSVAVAAGCAAAVAAWCWFRSLAAHEPVPARQTALAGITALALLATPAGSGIVALAGYNAEASLRLGATEWQPLWAPANRQFAPAVLAGALAALAVLWRRPRLFGAAEIVPLVLTLVMTVLAVRFLPFFAVALVPALAHAPLGSLRGHAPRQGLLLPGLATSLVLGGLFGLTRPVALKTGIPLAALRQIAGQVRSGPLFNDPALGGSIVTAVWPHWQVSYDGRFYLYRPDEIARLEAARCGRLPAGPPGARAPVGYVLARPTSAALIARLQADPARWRTVYANDWAVFIAARPPARTR